MKLYQKIKNETLGKNFDIDHAYGNQCWDFVCYVFEHYYNGKRIHCGLTTYVQDFVTQKETNGILEFMDDIGLNTILEPGDVCVWGQCSAAPYSHVALYDSDNGSNQVFFLGQNQGEPRVTVTQIDISGIIGVFRAKNMNANHIDAADPILAIGSKVKFDRYLTVEKIDLEKNWVYNSQIGGWVSASICTETSSADGACDQILYNGAQFTIDGTYTVGAISKQTDTVYINELGFWVNTYALTENQ